MREEGRAREREREGGRDRWMVIARARARARERERERALGSSVLFRFYGWLWDDQTRSYDFAETLHRLFGKAATSLFLTGKNPI